MQVDSKTLVDKLVLLMNNIAKTPGISQGIVTKDGKPNLIPADMNGEWLLLIVWS